MSKTTLADGLTTDPRPTRSDVARRANVSGSTVSRVLSGREDQSVSPSARTRVIQAARELGYSPNSAAQMLRSGRTGLIGFWMCLEYSRYRGQVLDQMRRITLGTDLALAVSDVDEEYAGHHSLVRALRVPVDGIIAFDASIAAEAFAHDAEMLAPNLPFVSMGAFWAESKSYVGVDLKAGAIDATEHLLAAGRRRIAYVAPRGTPFVSSGARYDGYRDTVTAAGYEPRTIEIAEPAAERIGSLKEELAALRREGTLPDALLCMFDDIAMDAVTALLELGLTPGREVALVGFNGTEGIERGPYPISSVRQPIEEMCATAFEFLRAQIEEPLAAPGQKILKPTLQIRASSIPF